MPKFSRNFTIVSIAGLSLVVAILGYLYREHEISNLAQYAERQNAALMQTFVNSSWSVYSEFMRQLGGMDAAELRQNATVREFDKELRTLTQKLNIHVISVVDLTGKIVLSTNPRELGANQAANPGFLSAKAGMPESRLQYQNIAVSMDDLKLNRFVVVSYLPVYAANNPDVDAVFKFHLDVTKMVNAVNRSTTLVYGISGLLVFTLVAALFLLVSKAQSTINTLTNNFHQQEKYIEHQGCHDLLTGLPNRIFFRDRLEKAMGQSVSQDYLLALLFIDLDHFQKVNDALGYAVGDGVLMEVSTRLRQCVRSNDTIARIGGDEFVIILQSIRVLDEVEEITRQILNTISEEYVVEGHELFVSPSIGIAVYPFADEEDVNTLLKKANTAMNKAKVAGRNTFRYFTESARKQIASRFSTENALRRALERDEFELYYQPVVQSKSGKIIAVEALLRWHTEENVFNTPDKFIPLLEETGLIIPVGQWVLERACQQGVAWGNKGIRDLKINVNMSARQLLHKDLVQQVNDVLDLSGLQPHLLDLEITESLLIEDFKNTIHILDNLKEAGIALSIDDFGTGYSSLSYLKRMPVDTLKIDQSFVQDIAVNIDDAAIVEAICALSKSLRFKVTAEGVENHEQLEYLKRSGVNAIQGYLVSKPLPAAEVEGVLKQGRILNAADPAA